MHDATKIYNTPEDLGPPSFNRASSSRMSPVGIPVFYGSIERETAIKEIIGKSTEEKQNECEKIITVGKWKTLQEFRVLDFARLPSMPSLFDDEMRKYRDTISFLESFSDEISQPMNNCFKEIEYIPTQVFTEYIKYLYKDRENKGIDGILYKSTVRDDGVNCVLFLMNNDCCDRVKSNRFEYIDSDQKMILENYERITCDDI
jgi:hypothetical protein